MSLLGIFERSKLQSAWEYETEGVIWRLLPSAGNIIIGEARNIPEKQVSFFCLNCETGTPLWQNLTFEERWWISIEHVHRNILFLHEFATPDLPDHKKIRAVDALSGKLLWVNDEVQFLFAHEDLVYVTKTGFETRKFYTAGLNTGSLLSELTPAEFQQVQSLPQPEPTAIAFPVRDDERNFGGREVKSSLAKAVEHSVYAERIECAGKAIVAFYVPESQGEDQQPKLKQELAVFDEKGKQLFFETINTGMAFPVPDAFMCIGETLLFIRNKKTLVAITLK